MTATFEWHIITTSLETVNPAIGGSATNWNLMSTDAYDSSTTDYQNNVNKLKVSDSGTNYSYERWIRGYFRGSATAITNVKIYRSAGTLSDSNLVLNGGETDTFATPVKTASSIATTASTSWDTLAEAFDITPAAGITSLPAWSDYFVIQMAIPDTVNTLGEMGTITLTLQYDETP